ncbi:hypothetical protein M378DRAFT_25730 [Amanita muscaria Koide BX008]|uniref:Uncharacterized protein n=1 Tax=Amanita muscaria (strain Koide BX008) TaxID=946122 RepID=A0A0C2X0J5_AMAMK|nr:hypothetical protein M378DRAFT_25730 [Amanita muscaria Koide BX008]
MSTATAKAEARRKAILARKGERLEKLATSARGEDGTYLHQDQQTAHNAALNEFVGESSGVNMPTPAGLRNSRGTSPAPSLPTSTAPSSRDAYASLSEGPGLDQNVWTSELQGQFLQALMAGARQPTHLPDPIQQLRTLSQSSTSDRRSVSRESSLPPFDAIMPPFPLDPQFESRQGMNVPATRVQKPKTLYQKLVPAIHLMAMGCLLLWFVLWRGGEYSYLEHGGDAMSVNPRFWERWTELARRPPQIMQEPFGVVGSSYFLSSEANAPIQQNFFWAFTTLQIVLHSTRLLSGIDDLQPSTFLSLVLSQLPQRISTVVLSILRYMQLGAMFLDDVACLVVALGFLVYIATLIIS